MTKSRRADALGMLTHQRAGEIPNGAGGWMRPKSADQEMSLQRGRRHAGMGSKHNGKVAHWHTDARGMASGMGSCARCRGFLSNVTPHDNNVPVSSNKLDKARFDRFTIRIKGVPARGVLRLVR